MILECWSLLGGYDAQVVSNSGTKCDAGFAVVGPAGGTGKLVPKFELAGMYSYIDFHPGTGFDSWSNQGGTGSFTYNANKWLGLTAEAATYAFSRTTPTGRPEGGFQTFLAGPRLNLRRNYFVPFL